MRNLIYGLLFLSSIAFARTQYQVYTMPASGNLPDWGAVNLGKSPAVTGESAGACFATSTGSALIFGTLPVTDGGLGISTVPTNGQIPIGNGTNYVASTLTATGGVSITNASGQVTIAETYPIPSPSPTGQFLMASQNGYVLSVPTTNVGSLGYITFSGCSSGFWTQTGNTMSPFTALTGCSYTTSGSVSAPTGGFAGTPAFTLSGLAGTYEVTYIGDAGQASGGTGCGNSVAIQLFDSASNNGASAAGWVGIGTSNANSGSVTFFIKEPINFTSYTFLLKGESGTSTCPASLSTTGGAGLYVTYLGTNG